MKIIEKISLIIFANLILILSVILSFVVFGWLELDVIHNILVQVFQIELASNIILGVCIVLILLAIKCIFFDSDSSSYDGAKDGILLENESGKLLVSRDTLENLTNGVVKGFENTENITSRIELDKENNVSVFVTLTVRPNTIIKDLSNNLQARIKETIKTSLDLDVKEVNVRIKNVAQKQDTSKGGETNGEL